MRTLALHNWDPATGPVNIAFVENGVFHGSGFPLRKYGRRLRHPLGADLRLGTAGRDLKPHRRVRLQPGRQCHRPAVPPLVHYNGDGKSTVAALASGPHGWYFSDLYNEDDFNNPTARGANVLRLRYVGGAPLPPPPPEPPTPPPPPPPPPAAAAGRRYRAAG